MIFNAKQIGDAKGGIKLTLTPKDATRAKAYLQTILNKEAGGQYIGNTGLVQFVKDINQVPQDVIKTIAQYTTTPGLVYTVYNEGKKTKEQITTRMATDPQFKQDVENVVTKIKTTGSDILSTVTDPIVSTSKLITWLPYIVVGTLATFAFYVVKNPGSISTPRKVSVF
jgi:hypothetical protein